MHYKISQLLLTPGSKASTTSEIFVAQPDANKEELAGKLFALIEIESKKSADLKIINFIIENLNANYYQNEKMVLRERVKTVKIEHIFESALAKTNKNLAEFISAEKLKFNPKSMNATVGVIYENSLHFANLGKNKAFLIYKSPAKDEFQETTKKYSITDIIKRSESQEKKSQINLAKLFSSVISGSLPRSGYFLFTNEALPEYLSNKQIVEIISSLPPASAAEQIKNSLSKINHYVSFLGLIVKNTTGLAEPREVKKEIYSSAAGESVSELVKMEEKTEKLLTPGGHVSFKKLTGLAGNVFSKLTPNSKRNKTEVALSAVSLKDKIFFRKKSNLLKIKQFGSLLKNALIYFIGFFIYLFKLATDKEKMNELLHNIKSLPSRLKEIWKRFISWFKNLNKINKTLFIIAMGSLLLFTVNITVLSFKNNKVEEKQVYESSVKPIEQKQNQIEASLLYGNEDRAKELLSEIKDLLAGLPQKTNNQIEKYNELNEKYKEQLEKIRHAVKIEAPKELANFSNLNQGAQPTNIILSPTKNNKLYSGDTSQKTIYSLNLSDNLITAIGDTGQTIKTLDFPAVFKDSYIYYFNDGNIIELETEKDTITSIPLDLGGEAKNISASVGYNNRLYLANKLDGQIYRFNKRPNGFVDRTSWLNENADLSSATSMSVDGNLYILKNNEVLKYLKGEKQDFKLDSVEPSLEKGTKIIVSEEGKFVYILEPANKRLIIFDKTGKFLMQYQIDQFNELKDFAIDEKIKKIYFLNGPSVFEITGEHFEQ